MLSPEETLDLIHSAQSGNDAALERLVSENLALVKSVVKRYLERGVEYDDLFQLGCMGLVKAIRNFDARFEVRFSTYAVPMIAGEMRRFLRDDGPVKVSRSLKELHRRAVAAAERLEVERGAPVGVKEIARVIDASPEDVALALGSARQTISLNTPIGDEEEGATRQDLLPAEMDEERRVDRMLLLGWMEKLDGREKRILLLRYFRDCTQTRAAELLGVSQVQISRLETRILKKLRAYAEEKGESDALESYPKSAAR